MPDPTVALFRDAVRAPRTPAAGGAVPAGLTAPGVAVLLVYGAQIRVARNGTPGIRVTAGYRDGTVLLEAVGFQPDDSALNHWHPRAYRAMHEAEMACVDAGLTVRAAPHRTSDFPARVVSR